MYDNLIKVDKKFKASVNLQYDLSNEEKIRQYVPTTDLCDVIKKYIKAVLENNNKSTFLAGPYGKGKSYLMLIITYLLGKRSNQKLFLETVEKIKPIDIELADLLLEINKEKISLLPVVINNNSDDINQSFMLSLRNSLIENEINDIVPESAFKQCLEYIENWKNDSTESFDILKLCQKKLGIKIDTLVSKLKSYDMKAFETFNDLYKCVTHGCAFNPIASNDIPNCYEDISIKLSKYGYSGIFVVFDEFGVFLENQNDGFVTRLNRIQAFAEKCNSSTKDHQLHICCITHKDVTLYKKEKEQNDSFEKIAGRFKQYRFDRSLEENYQLICSAFKKKEEYYSFVEKYCSSKEKFYSEVKEMGLFANEEQYNYIVRNGFPFNPVALYALVRVSEKVAQNERTLFTFLSDNDVNSFNYFISNSNSGLINVSHIYDYFEILIKDSAEYKDIYFYVESLKRMSTKSLEHDVLKVIAITKIVNDDIRFSSSIKNIANSLGKTVPEIKETIEELVNAKLLKYQLSGSAVDFMVILNEETNKQIDKISSSLFSNLKTSDLLTKFDDNKYFVSHKYNLKNKMIRYYRSVYLSYDDFINLNSFDSFYKDEFSDGLIINVLSDNKSAIDTIKNKISSLPNNIIAKFNNNKINVDLIDRIKFYFAAKKYLEEDKKIDESTRKTLSYLMLSDYEEISNYLRTYSDDAICIYLDGILSNNLKDCINATFENYYNKSVCFNNDQINKNDVSSTSIKSRNIVIDSIIKMESKECFLSGTSQEATIYQTFDEAVKKSDVIQVIKNWFIEKCGEKSCALSLIDKLVSAPYGMRKGAIPLFIAQAISELTIKNNDSVETVLLYNDSSEIGLDSSNLSKLILNPSKYYFCYQTINTLKIGYLDAMCNFFEDKNNVNSTFSEKLQSLVKCIKLSIQNKAPIILNVSEKDNYLGLSKEAIKFKNTFMKHDLNAYDVIFDVIPRILNCDYENCDKKIKNLFKEFDKKYEMYKKDIIIKVKSSFNLSSNSIKDTYELWKSKHPYITQIVFDNNEKMIFKGLEDIMFDDMNSIDILSSYVFGFSLAGWNKKSEETFFNYLNRFIATVDNFENTPSNTKIDNKINYDSNYKLSSLGKTLYSNLTDSLEEYGYALSNEEKVAVLKKLLAEILD